MDPLLVRLEQLESAQLVRRLPEEELAYLFKHGLTQEAAYESLLVKKRREVHRLVAQAYERLYADRLDDVAFLLTQHFREAGDDDKVAEYAVRAGDHAARLSAEPEAAALYAQALEALSRLHDSIENRRVRTDILIKRTAVSFTTSTPEQSLSDLLEAKSLVDDLLRTDAASPGDRLRLARVQAWIARMHFFRQERRAALEDFDRLLPLAEEAGDEGLATLALNMMGRIWLWGGAFDRALPLLKQTLPSLEQSQNWTEWILNDGLVGVALAAGGNYHAGVAEAERALGRANDLRFPNGTAVAYGMLALIHMMGGAILPMLEASRAALQIAVPSGITIASYMAWSARAWAESRLGQHQAALDSMARAESAAQIPGSHLFLDDWLAAIKIEMALNAGRIEETLARVEQAVSFARSVDGRFAEALVQRAWGTALARLDPAAAQEAETHFASSLDLLDAGGALLEAARTQVAWGQALKARGDTEAAREHLQRAAAQFQASGLDAELQQTQLLLDMVHN